MAELGSCATCGAPLRPNALAGALCPACLLQRALRETDGDSPSGADIVAGGLEPGTILGRFRLGRLIGKGGMAAVYEAYETPPLERTVALKVLPPEFLHDETFARRFAQEARVVASLEHPNIVPIYASGIDNGIPWLSMRLLSGGSLATVLDGGHLSVTRTTMILRDIGDALDYAHLRGVIHRDLKPSNILLDDAGRAYICDFGLARLIEGHDRWTRTGSVVGTPQYMAPEQALGTNLDHRCDIYGLGVLAYEMLCGTPPFHGDSPVATLLQHANAPLPMPPGELVPESLFRSLRKALAKKRDDRWSTAAAFVSAFQAATEAPAPGGKALPALNAAALLVVAVGLLWSASKVVGMLAPEQDLVFESPPRSAAPTIVGRVDSSPPRWEDPAVPTSSSDGATVPGSESRNGRATSSRPPMVSPIDRNTSVPQEQDAKQQSLEDLPSDSLAVTVPDGGVASPATANRDEKKTTQGAGDSVVVPDGARVRVDVKSEVPDTAPAQTIQAGPSAERNIVTPPFRIRTVNPTYPDIAQAAQIEGDVLVGAVVGPDGRVTEADVLRSVHPVLDEAARQAVLQFRYTPGVRNGVPDTFRIQVPVSFRLK